MKFEEVLDNLLNIMDKIYRKAYLISVYEAWSEFDRFRKSEDTFIEQYVMEFSRRYKMLPNHRLVFPQSLLAFELLDCAKLTKVDGHICKDRLLLTVVNFTENNTL